MVIFQFANCKRLLEGKSLRLVVDMAGCCEALVPEHVEPPWAWADCGTAPAAWSPADVDVGGTTETTGTFFGTWKNHS